jgi:hypothetical protein
MSVADDGNLVVDDSLLVVNNLPDVGDMSNMPVSNLGLDHSEKLSLLEDISSSDSLESSDKLEGIIIPVVSVVDVSTFNKFLLVGTNVEPPSLSAPSHGLDDVLVAALFSFFKMDLAVDDSLLVVDNLPDGGHVSNTPMSNLVLDNSKKSSPLVDILSCDSLESSEDLEGIIIPVVSMTDMSTFNKSLSERTDVEFPSLSAPFDVLDDVFVLAPSLALNLDSVVDDMDLMGDSLPDGGDVGNMPVLDNSHESVHHLSFVVDIHLHFLESLDND